RGIAPIRPPVERLMEGKRDVVVERGRPGVGGRQNAKPNPAGLAADGDLLPSRTVPMKGKGMKMRLRDAALAGREARDEPGLGIRLLVNGEQGKRRGGRHADAGRRGG